MKVTKIPFIVGAPGTASKKLDKRTDEYETRERI